jgi:hypothetical protein
MSAAHDIESFDAPMQVDEQQDTQSQETPATIFVDVDVSVTDRDRVASEAGAMISPRVGTKGVAQQSSNEPAANIVEANVMGAGDGSGGDAEQGVLPDVASADGMLAAPAPAIAAPPATVVAEAAPPAGTLPATEVTAALERSESLLNSVGDTLKNAVAVSTCMLKQAGSVSTKAVNDAVGKELLE